MFSRNPRLRRMKKPTTQGSKHPVNNQSQITSSVGIVQTQTMKIPLPEEGFGLRNGGILHEIIVAYETYGKLSPQCDNVVYICHALTGDAHVAGYHDSSERKPGWWDDMVGPGKGIDTNYYFVVCANILGGCNGTTGPSSINPTTGKPYGSAFPDITVTDIVHVQKLLLEQLGIDRLAAVIGGSLGGMQVLEWSVLHPEMVARCICIACGSSLSTQALAFDVVARDALLSDPNWVGGDYYERENKPTWGLSHARKIGHITYLSPEIMQKKFGREKTTNRKDDTKGHRFQVESYLDYQGQKLVRRFDANSYLRIANAMDSYDLIEEFGSLKKAFEKVQSKFLVIALSSDWLFPPEQSVALADALIRAEKQVSCCTLDAPYGHDAFLVDIEHLTETVRAFLPWVSPKKTAPEKPATEQYAGSTEHRLICEMVKLETRVLDLGCGSGDLLSLLKAEKRTSGFGVDIDLDNLIQAIDKGHDVFQGDLDKGLSIIPDKSYDYAILSSTLQVVKKPRAVLREMTRVAQEGIVTFPNFGNWHNRLTLGLRGRMPKSDTLHHEWYDTPNIHLTTLQDFVELCRQEGIDILDMICIPGKRELDKFLISLKFYNLGAARVLVRIARQKPGSVTSANCR